MIRLRVVPVALIAALFLSSCSAISIEPDQYVQGQVWLDTDGNARLDKSDPPATGTVVGLYAVQKNGELSLIAETTITKSKEYYFQIEGVFDNYIVKFTPPRSSVDVLTLLVDSTAPPRNFTTEKTSVDSDVFRVEQASHEGYSRQFPDFYEGKTVNAGIAINAHLDQESVTQPEETPTPDPLAWLNPFDGQSVSVDITIVEDKAGHAPFGNYPDMMDLTVGLGDDFKLTAPPPWINVEGPLSPDGLLNLEGTGSYAGYSNIFAKFTGRLTPDGYLSGQFEVGANGGLPSGLSITYGIDGQFSPNLLEGGDQSTLLDQVEMFYSDFNEAMNRNDGTALWQLTHPAVADVYGEKLCISYLEKVAQNPVQVRPLRVTDQGKWTWEPPGRTPVPLNDILSVDVEVTLPDGSTSQQETHLGWRDDTHLGFFTQCDAQ